MNIIWKKSPEGTTLDKVKPGEVFVLKDSNQMHFYLKLWQPVTNYMGCEGHMVCLRSGQIMTDGLNLPVVVINGAFVLE